MRGAWRSGAWRSRAWRSSTWRSGAWSRGAWPLVYLGVALVVAGPLLAPGFVFALDHAMGPRSAEYYGDYVAHNDDAISSKGAYAVLLGALDMLLPMWIVQKLILFVPFFLAGYGAHRLAQDRVGATVGAALFAGLVYALSPFAYLRGVSGQTGVLWAYALAPWFFRAYLSHVETGSRRAFAAAVLLVAATLVFQAHGVILLVLLVALHTLVRLARAPRDAGPWREQDAGPWREQLWSRLRTLRAPLALAGASALVNAYWLVPVLLSPETTLARIGDADRDFFATTDAGLPSVGAAALTLQGFWREGYASPFPVAALLVVPAIVLFLSVHGLRQRAGRDDGAVAVALAGGLALALAAGGASRVTSGLTDLVWDHVPFMRGFRDAHKLLALLALAYAYLAPSGVEALLGSARRWRLGARGTAGIASRASRVAPTAILALLVAAPVATAMPLLGGYGGQLGVADYPAEWARVEEMTAGGDGCDGSMLVLPWHLYLDESWLPNVDKRVAQPAKLYFTCPVLSSDDLELGAAASQASTPATAYVDHWMDALADGTRSGPREIHRLGELLAPVGVRHVLLLKESDWRSVADDLDAQDDLRLVLDEGRVRLYESTANVVTGVRVAQVARVDALDDLVPLAETRDLASTAVLVASREAAEGLDIPEVVATATPTGRAPPSAWRLDGEPPLFASYGVAPAFDAAAEGRPHDAGIWTATLLWALSAVSAASLYLFGQTAAHHSTKYPEQSHGAAASERR